ncbi:MAG: EVE domain-containing protein [Bryobacteraceae bacterium]
MNYWIFKCDPTKYWLDARLADREPRTRWHISRYRKKVQADDIAFIWQTGKHRAIRATIRIDSSPQDMQELDSEQKYLASPDSSVRCRVDATILRRDSDVSADRLRTIAGLENLSAFKRVPAGIYSVTPEEAAILLRVIE